MGAWGEGPLDNDTAADLEVFWRQYVAHGRTHDPEFWSAVAIAELFRFLYFKGYGNVRPDQPGDAEKLLAVGALFARDQLELPAELKQLVEAAANFELRRTRLQEWAKPPARKRALEALLADIGGKRRRGKALGNRAPADDVVEIERFMQRANHWVRVVKLEAPYDNAYDSAEPAFVSELKRFCFAGTDSDTETERRRAIRARLMALGYVTGWMLNLPSEEVLHLIEAAHEVKSPAGPAYAWAAEMFAS